MRYRRDIFQNGQQVDTFWYCSKDCHRESLADDPPSDMIAAGGPSASGTDRMLCSGCSGRVHRPGRILSLVAAVILAALMLAGGASAASCKHITVSHGRTFKCGQRRHKRRRHKHHERAQVHIGTAVTVGQQPVPSGTTEAVQTQPIPSGTTPPIVFHGQELPPELVKAVEEALAEEGCTAAEEATGECSMVTEEEWTGVSP